MSVREAGWQRIHAGRTRKCWRCDREIDPGEECYVWELGASGEHTRCCRDSCRPASEEMDSSSEDATS